VARNVRDDQPAGNGSLLLAARIGLGRRLQFVFNERDYGDPGSANAVPC